MSKRGRTVWLSGLTLLIAGCNQPWPSDLPARTYTGVAINGPLKAPAVGAVVRANRPTFERRGFSLALIPGDSEIGFATTDAEGHFSLRTTTGYATFLTATTSDRHLSGRIIVKRDETENLRIDVNEPAYGQVEYGGGVDPNLPVFKVAGPAVQQIIRYASAHPLESMHSLQEYARRGVISEPALDAFTGNAAFFFGPTPRVEYGWGKDVIVIPDVHGPITLRRGRSRYDPVIGIGRELLWGAPASARSGRTE